MGIEFDAFLGRISDLQTWYRRFPSAVVCELSGEIGLVPVTPELAAQLSLPSRLGCWGCEASAGTVIAYVSIFEFGDQGGEEATLWMDGREVLSGVDVGEVLSYFRDRAGLDLGDKPIDLERYRGSSAAEKWAASACKRAPK